MILLDTHVWIWWVHGDSRLPASLAAALELQGSEGLAVSAISCWEVSKLVERARVTLPMELEQWLSFALGGSGVGLVSLTPGICARSTRLEGFHPADQIITATAILGEMEFPPATAESSPART